MGADSVLKRLRETMKEGGGVPPLPKDGDREARAVKGEDRAAKDRAVSVFTPPVSAGGDRVRIIAEVERGLGERFKELCRRNGWRQRDVVVRFLSEFVEHHGG